jgi:hypothetical protein
LLGEIEEKITVGTMSLLREGVCGRDEGIDTVWEKRSGEYAADPEGWSESCNFLDLDDDLRMVAMYEVPGSATRRQVSLTTGLKRRTARR